MTTEFKSSGELMTNKRPAVLVIAGRNGFGKKGVGVMMKKISLCFFALLLNLCFAGLAFAAPGQAVSDRSDIIFISVIIAAFVLTSSPEKTKILAKGGCCSEAEKKEKIKATFDRRWRWRTWGADEEFYELLRTTDSMLDVELACRAVNFEVIVGSAIYASQAASENPNQEIARRANLEILLAS